ncbi:MAG: hypothetical protein HOV80_06050, partial [Polyangiaceae bacterium]|nr:hypothetical protein [Polyangiaceae bacterium]
MTESEEPDRAAVPLYACSFCGRAREKCEMLWERVHSAICDQCTEKAA